MMTWQGQKMDGRTDLLSTIWMRYVRTCTDVTHQLKHFSTL